MKIYLAAQYARRNELKEYAKELCSIGHDVMSSWLYHNDEALDDNVCDNWQLFALRDFVDLKRCECIISFTEPVGSRIPRGSRHVELGMAIGLNKRCIIVGHRENVFCFLPRIEFFEDWNACKVSLSQSSEVPA